MIRNIQHCINKISLYLNIWIVLDYILNIELSCFNNLNIYYHTNCKLNFHLIRKIHFNKGNWNLTDIWTVEINHNLYNYLNLFHRWDRTNHIFDIYPQLNFKNTQHYTDIAYLRVFWIEMWDRKYIWMKFMHNFRI